MSGYIANYRANKRPKKKKNVTRPVQMATGSSPQSSSGGQVSTPHVSAPRLSVHLRNMRYTESNSRYTRKQAR